MNLSILLKNKHLQSLAGNLLPALLGLVSFMLLARGLSKSDFGSWALYLSTFTLLEMIKSGGVQTALVMQISGKTEQEKNTTIGAAWKLISLLSLAAALLLLSISFFTNADWNAGLIAFLYVYPLVGFITIPFNLSQAILQSEHRFDRLLLLRFVTSTGLLIIAGAVFWYHLSLLQVIVCHALLQLVCCVFLLVSGWVRLHTIKLAPWHCVKDLFHLGKYSFGTLAATNMLKSADTFLIGAFMGPAAVGLYSVPLRLVEVLEIPLRSAVGTAFPRFSALYNIGEKQELRTIFYQYAGVVSWLFVPLLAGCFVLSDSLVVWLGGESYAASAGVFRVFLCYGLFLPLDRFTGVLLDALQKPSLNLKKVLVMASFNIVGDVAALYFLQDLRAVACVSVCNAILGIVLGFTLSRRFIYVRISETMVRGWKLVSGGIRRYIQPARKEEPV
jgi:O-antigen/teichoic acid export membrane protein